MTKAFESILDSSGRQPIKMNVDRGKEFTSDRFKNMLVTSQIKQLRFAEARNDIATIDSAIASLKLLITKRTITTGAGNWAQELKAATASYNKSPHEHLGMEQPSSVEGTSCNFNCRSSLARITTHKIRSRSK